VALANGRLFPAGLLLASGRRKRDGADSQHHEERAPDDFEVDGRTAAVQLAKNKNSPQQPPELVGVGERDAAADAHVLCSKLLEDVANHPHEADAKATSVAAAHMTRAPPRIRARRRQPAWRSSLKKRNPQRMPRRLLEFHKGKAMLRPMSRMAKIVSVLATAQRHPASRAQITR